MPKETWTIAGVLTITLLLGLLGFSSWDKKQRLDQAQADLSEMRAEAAKSEAAVAELKSQLAES
ncbi:MAG TPA: hypothetical protein VHI52_13885, partial [Verrucomicrobiae bacterium]|nr:hypothetical protein [Verrucomicrobiae bacterium]